MSTLLEAFGQEDGVQTNRKEIFVSIRVDSAKGSGTRVDPYNGSTDDLLDELLRNETVVPENTIVRFGPGIFQTKGNGGKNPGFTPRSGQRFVGAGVYQTTLQLVKAEKQPPPPPPADDNKNFIGVFAEDSLTIDGLEISDMTIDCNLARQPLVGGSIPSIRVDAIRLLTATNVRIRRVRVINWGTYLPYSLGPQISRPFGSD